MTRNRLWALLATTDAITAAACGVVRVHPQCDRYRVRHGHSQVPALCAARSVRSRPGRKARFEAWRSSGSLIILLAALLGLSANRLTMALRVPGRSPALRRSRAALRK